LSNADPRSFERREDELSVDDPHDEGSRFRRSPTGPRVAPPRKPVGQLPAQPRHGGGNNRRFWSTAIFILLISGVGIRAYRDLSRPQAWAYWKESYLSPSMTSALIPGADLDGSGHGRRALAISGEIGAATANWFRDRLDEGHLAAGDAVLLSSPGGDLNQAVIMGEILRSRGLVTAVGVADASGQVRPAYCVSACVLVYAGGKIRYGMEGSMLGVHQFEATAPMRDPVASTQRVAGFLLSYMTKMGVSPAVVEAMSQTSEVRWLGVKEAAAMNLVTDPVRKP
jgi:hypothetical protein